MFALLLVMCLPFAWLLKAALLLMNMLVVAYSVAYDALLILYWSCHQLILNKDNEIVVAQ
jgi:hypothetical protein